MDSTFPSSNFMDLLHSQNTPTSHGIPFPCVELGSSQVPLFNETSEPRDGDGDGNIGRSRVSRPKWQPKEDIVLCSAWLNTSKDSVIGNEQKHNAFWKRITAYYNASPKMSGCKEREPDHCKQRWGRINEQVCKFVGCFEAAKRQLTSGQNEDDLLKLANEIFFNDYNTKFSLVHAWLELRNDQKWKSYNMEKSGTSSKKRKVDDPFTSSNTTFGCDDVESRPVGVKAAKKRGKSSMSLGSEDSKSFSKVEHVWAMKEKDNKVKERVSTLDLIHSLVNNKKDLSEIETALKDKLIMELLE